MLLCIHNKFTKMKNFIFEGGEYFCYSKKYYTI